MTKQLKPSILMMGVLAVACATRSDGVDRIDAPIAAVNSPPSVAQAPTTSVSTPIITRADIAQSCTAPTLSGANWASYRNFEPGSVAVDHTGNVWSAGRGGVVRWAVNGSYTHYTTRDGLASNDGIHVAIAPDGAVWAGMSGGVSRFDGQTWTTYTAADGLATNYITGISIAPGGNTWVSMDLGVARYRGGP